MTSKKTFPRRLTKVDELILSLGEHYYLCPEDECYFIGEYTAGMGFDYSDTNQLISNFKKEMDRKGRPEWRYKGIAIREAARAFRVALEPLNAGTVAEMTFVPMPPSKAKSDPLYDPRLTTMLRLVRTPPLDVRELIVQTQSTIPAHLSEDRPSPEGIESIYAIDEDRTMPEPSHIGIVDDVLTTGAHFRAAQRILSKRFPCARVTGLFITRRVIY